MASGDLGSVSALLRGIVRAVESQKNNIAIVALKEVEGEYKTRIFNNGQATNGTQIGEYSTKPMLVGSSSFITKAGANAVFGSKRKRKKLNWATIRTPKGNRSLAILPGGYKQFRKLNGRQNSKVDLELSSDLRNGIQVGTSGGDPVLGFINELSADKAEGQEKHWRKQIFTASTKEVNTLDRVVEREITRIIQRVVRSV